MTPERAEELKQLILVPMSGHLLPSEQDDLLALLDEAIARQNKPLTQFEAWKRGLTLMDLTLMVQRTCLKCPLLEKCQQANFKVNKSCYQMIKDWGEQDAE